MTALPRWRSHKVVEAARVLAAAAALDDGATLALDGVGMEDVDAAYLRRTVPLHATLEHLVGGYFVRYENGFTSWSPADAFEGGYTRIE